MWRGVWQRPCLSSPRSHDPSPCPPPLPARPRSPYLPPHHPPPTHPPCSWQLKDVSSYEPGQQLNVEELFKVRCCRCARLALAPCSALSRPLCAAARSQLPPPPHIHSRTRSKHTHSNTLPRQTHSLEHSPTQVGDLVDIAGTTIGKGFQGGVKK